MGTKGCFRKIDIVERKSSMRELQIPSVDGIHALHVVVWEPQGEKKAVLQISHGMVEFIERYADFAEYLNDQGFVVVGNDHLGHGKTAGCDEDLGYFCKENMSAAVINDLHSVTLEMKKQYPGIPYFLLGHSMGSFMARRYLMTYGDELDGAVLSGTGAQPGVVLAAGKIIAGIIQLIKGERYRSAFMQNMSFSAYNKRIHPVRTKNDWLTKDETIVDWYNANKYCTFNFTLNGYRTLFEVLSFIQNKSNMEKIPKSLPVFMVAGEEDPVGAYGKQVTAIYEQYKTMGIKDISCKLYPNDRHEILNETDKETVYKDIADWLNAHMQ